MATKKLLSKRSFLELIKKNASERYPDRHPFNQLLYDGKLNQKQIQFCNEIKAYSDVFTPHKAKERTKSNFLKFNDKYLNDVSILHKLIYIYIYNEKK